MNTNPSLVCLDARDHIGPHHLSIGKTRKVFEYGGVVHAFFSRGYDIAHARIDPRTLSAEPAEALDLPVAWGGGAFCVDQRGGTVKLVFTHRNQLELCLAEGTIAAGTIQWQPWRRLLFSASRQAAPWLEIGADGTAWASVLEREGGFRLAVIAPGGAVKTGDLFDNGETGWYHSCVQMLPVGDGLALAVGFRGAFPQQTELVFKTVSAGLELGPALTLAPCNVNDNLTFHFQAVGDSERGFAHIVYLDKDLHVSHALWRRSEWHVSREVVPCAAFAPQVAIDGEGRALLMAADYEGRLWKAAWSEAEGWCEADIVPRVAAPNTSGLFGQTGFGTGGLITAARSESGRLPYLVACIDDDRQGRARLCAGVLGEGERLGADPVSVRREGRAVHAEIRLDMLRDEETREPGRSWQVVAPLESGALRLCATASGEGLSASAEWCRRDGTVNRAPARVEAVTHDLFMPRRCPAILRLDAELPFDLPALKPGGAWVEIYDGGGRLAEIAPFKPETNAAMALDPARILSTFKRMV